MFRKRSARQPRPGDKAGSGGPGTGPREPRLPAAGAGAARGRASERQAQDDSPVSERLNRVARYASSIGSQHGEGASEPPSPKAAEPKAAAPTMDRPAPDAPMPEAPVAEPEPEAEPEPGPGDEQIFHIARNMRLIAKLCECEEIHVEGHLEANARARFFRIAEGGHFVGTADVVSAEIRGRFAGNLTVAGQLFIRSGGHVTGSIHYGEVAIEPGGVITGSVTREETQAEAEALDEPRALPAPAAVTPTGFEP